MVATTAHTRRKQNVKSLEDLFGEEALTIGVFGTGRIVVSKNAVAQTLILVFDALPSGSVRSYLKHSGFCKKHGREVYSCFYYKGTEKSVARLAFAQLVTDAVIIDASALASIDQFNTAHWKKYNTGSAKSRLLGLLTEWSLAYFRKS
jgi:hypothetical protein